MTTAAEMRPALLRLAAGEPLTEPDIAGAMEAIMCGQASETEIALLLTGLHFQGETEAQIAAAATVLRQKMVPVRTQRTWFLDTCGTGGDGSGTFNISTTAAIVVAAAGLPVAKHGNRSATSRSGSSEVLAELGVNVQADVPTVQACLDEVGLAFCFAPLYHGSLKHAALVRKRLGFPTLFNYLGPLANPAGAPCQLIGVGRAEWRPRLAAALQRLGCPRALVVWGTDGLDEITCARETHVSLLRDGTLTELTWHPRDFGLEPAELETLRVANPQESAALVRTVLAGGSGPARTIVLQNAAAALWLGGKVPTLPEGVSLAAEALDSRAAEDLLARLRERSHGRPIA